MFIFAVLLLLAAIVCALAKRYGWALAMLAAAILFLIVGSIAIVPARNVGIVTAFGKPTGRETGAGWQWVAPWQNVDDWDARRQMFDRGKHPNCVQVRIAGQRDACVETRIEWSAAKDAASENWAVYGKRGEDQSRFDAFTERRVEPQFSAVINRVFASFDPLSTVNPKTGDAAAPDLNALYRAQVIDGITSAIGRDVTVDSLAFGFIHYDERTSASIAGYGQRVLDGRNLDVDLTNAGKRKAVTEKNAEVPAVTRCLEIAEAGGKEPGLCMAQPQLVKPVG